MQWKNGRDGAVGATVDCGIADGLQLFSSIAPLATADDIIRFARRILVSRVLGPMVSS